MKISMNWPLNNNCNITNLFVLYRACCAFLCNCEYLKNELTIFVDLQRNCSARLDRLHNPWGLHYFSWQMIKAKRNMVPCPPVFYIKRDEGLYKRTNITIILKYRFLSNWVCRQKDLRFVPHFRKVLCFKDDIRPEHDKSQMKGLIKSKVRVDVSSVVLRQCCLTIWATLVLQIRSKFKCLLFVIYSRLAHMNWPNSVIT